MLRAARLLAPAALLAGAGCAGTSRPDLSTLLTPNPATSTVTAARAPQGAPGTPAKALDLPTAEGSALTLTMARSLDAAGKDAEALAHYEKARAADPKFPDDSLQRMAVLYDRADDQPKALAIFRELRERRPKDANLLNDLGYSLYNRGQWAEAEEALRAALKADERHARAWTNLGLTLAQQDRADEAFAAFTRAVSPADAHANVAFVRLSRKDAEGARSHYRMALELEPRHELARKMLAKLESAGGGG